MRRQLIRNGILFIIFGFIYYSIETIFKYPKPSHISMAIVGGLSGVVVGLINEYIPWEVSLWRQCLLGCMYITFFEAVSGYILNVWLKLGVWDYSHMPLNFAHGQCCIPFCAAWFVLAGIAIILDDYLRYWLFNEEKPHYYLRDQ